MDSGAGESVSAVNAFDDIPTVETAKVGTVYRAAGGQKLLNAGEKRPQFQKNGVNTSITFQATTGIKKPFVAASRITSKGNRVILDDEGWDSHIENKKTGVKVPIYLKNGVYMLRIKRTKSQPFTRPAQ